MPKRVRTATNVDSVGATSIGCARPGDRMLSIDMAARSSTLRVRANAMFISVCRTYL